MLIECLGGKMAWSLGTDARPGSAPTAPGERRSLPPAAGALVPLPPPDGAVLAIAHQVADQIKHALAMAAVAPGESYHPGSYAALARRFLKARSGRPAQARAKALDLLQAGPELRRLVFGRFADQGPEAHRRPGLLDADRFARPLFALGRPWEFASTPPPHRGAPPRRVRLGFSLDRVARVGEADEPAAEVLLSGFGATPAGTILPVPIRTVRDAAAAAEWAAAPWPFGGGAGDPACATASRRFVAFDVPAEAAGPRAHAVTIALSEEDDSGLVVFRQQLWARIGTDAAAAVRAAGLADGTSLAPLLSAVATAASHALIGWMTDLTDDEDGLIGVQTWVLSWAGDPPSSGDGPDRPGRSVDAKLTGADSRFDLTLSWEVDR